MLDFLRAASTDVRRRATYAMTVSARWRSDYGWPATSQPPDDLSRLGHVQTCLGHALQRNDLRAVCYGVERIRVLLHHPCTLGQILSAVIGATHVIALAVR